MDAYLFSEYSFPTDNCYVLWKPLFEAAPAPTPHLLLIQLCALSYLQLLQLVIHRTQSIKLKWWHVASSGISTPHDSVDRPLVAVSLRHTNHKLMLHQRSRTNSHLLESFMAVILRLSQLEQSGCFSQTTPFSDAASYMGFPWYHKHASELESLLIGWHAKDDIRRVFATDVLFALNDSSLHYSTVTSAVIDSGIH